MIQSFNSDIKKGTVGEQIFIQDYLKEQNIKYLDMTENPDSRKIDVDFIADYSYEIKNNYKDNLWICIEEYTNIEPKLGPVSYGWAKKTEAEKVVFISAKTRTMIILNWNNEFKRRYNAIRKDYTLQLNRITKYENSGWNVQFRQGAYRYIPLSEFEGMYQIYQKNNN